MSEKIKNQISEKNESEDTERLNTEWAFTVALREVVGVALKGESQPTYLQTLSLAQELFPTLFDENSLLLRQEESDVAKEFRQMAKAETSLQNKEISPLELLEAEISRYEGLSYTSSETDKLRQRLLKMYVAKNELSEIKHTEQQLILRDAIRTERKYPISGRGKDYNEYALNNNRILRIRVLHPDKPEHLMGADVIYENYWNERHLVRIAALQYKIWSDKTLYQESRMMEQIERLKNALCHRGFCQINEDHEQERYRLPYCSAFLRPTDKLQKSDSRFISTGYHIPICVVERIWEDSIRGGKKLTSKQIRSQSVTHKVFEELFNANMLGSPYVKYDVLERLYRDMEILDSSERIIIHAQELG